MKPTFFKVVKTMSSAIDFFIFILATVNLETGYYLLLIQPLTP